jgi:hypothetical protein
MIPCDDSAAALYRRLFLRGSPEEVEGQIRRLKLGQCIMDSVADDAGRLKGSLGPRDAERLDQYMTGVAGTGAADGSLAGLGTEAETGGQETRAG